MSDTFKKSIPVVLVFLVGLAFIDASFNNDDGMSTGLGGLLVTDGIDQPVLFRIIGGVLILAAWAGGTWFTRQDPINRNPMAIAGGLLLILGAVLTFPDNYAWNFIGLAVLIVGAVLLWKATKAENERAAAIDVTQASEPSATID